MKKIGTLSEPLKDYGETHVPFFPDCTKWIVFTARCLLPLARLKNAAWSLEKSASQFKKNLDLIKNTSYKAYFIKEYYLQQL